LQFLDPDQDYNYSPLSANIESEHNRFKKLQLIDQMVGRVVNIPNPNTPKLLNYLLKMAFELFGNEFPEFQKYLLDESPQAAAMQMAGGKASPQMPEVNPMPETNQTGVMQNMMEQYARGAISG